MRVRQGSAWRAGSGWGQAAGRKRQQGLHTAHLWGDPQRGVAQRRPHPKPLFHNNLMCVYVIMCVLRGSVYVYMCVCVCACFGGCIAVTSSAPLLVVRYVTRDVACVVC